jgi:hypothetical protein
VSDGVFQGRELLGDRGVRTESSGRDWAGIGIGLVGALAAIAMYVAGIWAVVVLVEALA